MKNQIKTTKTETDFRGWLTLTVKSTLLDEQIREHFQMEYPDNDIAVLQYFNLSNTFEVTLLPKESNC